MAGRGPAPDSQRLRRGAPARGDWQPSPDGGWQHELPEPPAGIAPAAAQVWRSWFTAWWAGHWTLDDVPNLRFVIRLSDRVNRGDVKRAGELRQWMDSFGLTPKGQMDRRWRRPDPPRSKAPWEVRREAAARRGGSGRYDHLRGPQPGSRDRLGQLQDESLKDRLKRIERDAGQRPSSRFETLLPDLDAGESE
jgi:hypothetical protein